MMFTDEAAAHVDIPSTILGWFAADDVWDEQGRRAMFERAMAHARTRSIPRLIMHFLWGNLPIMRIARRFRMHIVANAGEARAELDLPPRSFPTSSIRAQGAIPC